MCEGNTVDSMMLQELHTYFRTRSGEQFLSNSVVLGETPNVGEGTVLWNKITNTGEKLERSLPIPWDM